MRSQYGDHSVWQMADQAGEMEFTRLFQEILQNPMDKPLAQALLQDMPDEKPDIRHVLTMQEDEIYS